MNSGKLVSGAVLGACVSTFVSALLVGCGGSNEASEQIITPDENSSSNLNNNGGTQDTGSQTVTTSSNKLGAWIWYIDEAGLVKNNHQDMASYLHEMGVQRVFIKISDINYQWQQNKISFAGNNVSCGVWQDACEPENLKLYKDLGIEVWAWTYNDSHSYEEQADMLQAAYQVGYDGYVLDIEVEFDGNSAELEKLMQAHQLRIESLNIDRANFPIAVTTWGNPKDHDMDIALLDDYVDVFMPQTYVEKWGSAYVDDIAGAINIGDCEYRELGASRPVWHIVSHEDGILDADSLSEFVTYAGPNASVWRVSNSNLMTEIAAMDWHATEFQQQDCSENNFDM